MAHRTTLGLAGLICLLALVASDARGGVDEGMARYVPWSGSYWPIRDGLLIRGPLQKYDRATGRQAAQWELQENPPLPQVPSWFGYCHAWAASAVLDREPIRRRQLTAIDGLPMQLGIGDQKGLLTACHTDDVAQHYGVRYQGGPHEDRQDLYPDELWRVLQLYIKQRGIPLIMDIEEGEQVWNHPVYAYRVTYRPVGGNQYFGEMSLWMADDAVPPDIVGVQVAKQTYYFTFRLQGGSAVLGSARWVQSSVNNHPDFAWYPYIIRAENPEVNYDEVKGLVDASGSGPSGVAPLPGDRPDSPTGPQVTPGGSSLPSNLLPGDLSVPPNYVPGPEAGPSQPLAGQPQPYLLSPVELLGLVANKTSHFSLDVTVNKFDGGKYAPGEPFTIKGRSARAGFLYVLYLDSQGELAVLFPRPGESNQIPAQHGFRLPQAEAGYEFHAADAYGIHRIKAITTSVPLMFSRLSPGRAIAEQPVARPLGFTLSPSQRTLFKSVLGRYMSDQPIASDELGSASPHQVLGDFGQDEVAIYVGPAGPSETWPNQ